MILDDTSLVFFISVATALGVIFSVYLYFRNPQIKTDQITLKLREDVDSLTDSLREVREKHLVAVEKDLTELTSTIHKLSLTVTKLSTIIDERIPKLAR